MILSAMDGIFSVVIPSENPPTDCVSPSEWLPNEPYSNIVHWKEIPSKNSYFDGKICFFGLKFWENDDVFFSSAKSLEILIYT